MLGVFNADGHQSRAFDPSWENLEPFAEHALKLSAELLDVGEDAVRIQAEADPSP